MESIDEHLIQQSSLSAEPPADLTWWERRRPRYNMFLIGMIGLMLWQLFPMVRNVGWSTVIFWSTAYVLTANVFYCLGYLMPHLLRYYLKTDFSLADMASVIFNLGVIISLLTTSLLYTLSLLSFR